MPARKPRKFYEESIIKVHEDVCAECKMMLTDEAKAAIALVWRNHAEVAAARPALYRKGSPHYFRLWTEASQLMVKAAEMRGSSAIEAEHVVAGTRAMDELSGLKLSDTDGRCWLCPYESAPRMHLDLREFTQAELDSVSRT